MTNRCKDGWDSPGLRQRAIALAQELGARSAARKLGIPPTRLQKWVEFDAKGMLVDKKESPEKQALLEAQRELQKLKKENRELKEANLILKDLQSFFSKDRLELDSKRSLNSPKKDRK